MINCLGVSDKANLQSQNIKEGIEGHAVGWYSEVFDLLFTDLDKGAANHVWQKQLAEKPEKNSNEVEEDE